MTSSFFGLNIARQGLYTAKTNLNITSHNISNADTEGYSRQYGVQSATTPQLTASGYIGTGSDIQEIKRHREEYLDYKYWDVMDSYGEYSTKYEALKEIELVFDESSESGLTTYLDNVFTALQDLSINPSDEASRASFLSALKSFSGYVNDISSQLRDVQSDMNFGMKNTVEQINSLSSQIATVNVQIRNLELTGDQANDLRDKRNNLLDELSELVSINVDYTENAKGQENLKVTVNGQTLVNGGTASMLEIKARQNLENPEDNVDLYDIYWETGNELNLSNSDLSGKLIGYKEIRDGNNKENFKADVVSGQGTTTIVLNNVNRNDIPAAGEIKVNGQTLSYTGYTYDDATGEMTMTLDPSTPCPAGATSCSSGESVSFKGVPYYLKQLNEFVRTVAKEFNQVHEAGDSGTGDALLVYKNYTGTPPLDVNDSTTYNQITAGNFSVNEEIMDDVTKLKTKYNLSDGESASDLVKDLIGIRSDDQVFAVGRPDNFLQAISSELAIDTNYMKRSVSTEEDKELLINNQRLSVSDVDMDEEATNLVKFQQAYSMAAKIMSVFNEVYDVTINQLGV